MIGETALAAGAVIGVRHALETDHLAAIATLIEEGTERPGFVGASWGIGHAIPIAVLGVLFVALEIQLPESVTQLFEVFVGIILIYLGGRMLLAMSATVHHHDHGAGLHKHLRLGKISLGLTHHHFDDESFLVGLVHGFAGSGALVIVLVSTAPSMSSALAFLVTFSALSILTMTVISIVWGRSLDSSFTTYLKGFAGLFGIAIGVALLFEQLTILGPL